MSITKPIISIYAEFQIFAVQAIPGELSIYTDHISFKASGMIKDSELKDTFLFNEINQLQLQRGLLLHKLVIVDKENEVWHFIKINKTDAKYFINQYRNYTSK